MKIPIIIIAMALNAFSADNPNLSDRERAIAWAVQFAGEEGGSMAPRAIKNYPHAVAKAIAYGFQYPDYITPLFAASIGADASCAEMQSNIIATVLLTSGDTAFSKALSKADKKAQKSSADLLLGIFRFGKLDSGVKLSWKNYPTTYQAVQKIKEEG
jgi:hypothetical protein